MNSKSLVIILCFLASALAVWQLVLPKYEKIAVLNQEINQIQLKIQKLENLEAKLKDFSRTYNEKGDLIKKLYQFLPAGKDIPNALARFEALTFQSGMILNSIDFAEVETKKTTMSIQSAGDSETSGVMPTSGQAASQAIGAEPKAMAMSLNASGTYDSFRAFLDNLENCVRLTDIQSVSFSFEESDLSDFSVVANIYYK